MIGGAFLGMFLDVFFWLMSGMMEGRETLAKEVIRWTRKRCLSEATVSIAGRM